MAARFNKASDVLKDITRSLERAVNQFLTQLNRDVVRLTPRRTGRAARGWRYIPYKLGGKSEVLNNRVPYIGLLDMGYSKQAPNGIVEPAINRLIRRTYKL